jgi:DNA-binding CsgD family transcriptional regulator
MITYPWRLPPQHDPLPTVGAEALLAALDALDTGVMVCDARGRLLVHNHAAGRELADGGLLRHGPDNLLDVAGGTGLLALRRALHGAAFEHSHQLVPLRHGEQCLMLAVQPLRCDDCGAPRVLMLTGRRGLCPDLAVHHLGRVYALTPAEVSVLTSLLAGVRIGDMAAARGVKLSTVRTQVAALRAKLGVQRVDDITRLVAELPPMLGALGRQPQQAGLSRWSAPVRAIEPSLRVGS